MKHICTICGVESEWDDAWSWYGSIRDLDNGTIIKTCSNRCRGKAIVTGLTGIISDLREEIGLPKRERWMRRKPDYQKPWYA